MASVMADSGSPPDAGSAGAQATHKQPETQTREISPKVELAAALAAEFEALHGPPQSPIRTLRDYAREVHGKQGRIAALCLSGGGIRSASFALGVLQSLARHGLLMQFHYLSTVSGGGYIGCWLQAWRHQAGRLNVVIEALNQRDLDTGGEPPELTGLREYSAYLTPKRGITSADTWAAIALYVRNLILNWVVFAPVFLGTLVLPWLAYDLMAAVAEQRGPWMFWPWAAFGSLLLVAGLHSAAWQRRFGPPSDSGQFQFLAFVLMPVIAAASFLALASASGFAVPLGFAALWGAAVYLLAWGSAWVRAGQNLAALTLWPTAANPVPPGLEAALWVGCGALAGVLVVLAFGPYNQDLRERVVVTVGAFMLAILAAEILYVGLASYANTGDDDREWLARGRLAVRWRPCLDDTGRHCALCRGNRRALRRPGRPCSQCNHRKRYGRDRQQRQDRRNARPERHAAIGAHPRIIMASIARRAGFHRYTRSRALRGGRACAVMGLAAIAGFFVTAGPTTPGRRRGLAIHHRAVFARGGRVVCSECQPFFATWRIPQPAHSSLSGRGASAAETEPVYWVRPE